MQAGIARTVVALYRGSRELPAPAFQDWALEQVRAHVPFTSAIWGRAGMEDGTALIYSVHLHCLPPESLASYARFKDRDVVGAMAMRAMGSTVSNSASRLLDREMLEQHVRRFGLEHSLNTCLIDPRTSLVSFVTLFRPEDQPAFSEAERAAKEALAPHLVESCHQSRLMQLASGGRRERVDWETAACDTDLVLVAARPRFAEFMRREWPDWSGPRMPEPVRAALKAPAGRYAGSGIVLSYERVSDLYWLAVRERAPFDSLAPRQVEIARLTAKGSTHKEIARALGLAPATVRNHLDAAYRKLAIGSRAELATLLSRFD